MAARLRAAGFAGSDVQVFKPAPLKGNLIARLHGSGARKPILLLAHLDVVEARREDWSSIPSQLLEKDGYFYARGSADDKFHGCDVRFNPYWLQAGRVQTRSRHRPDTGDRRRNSRPEQCRHAMANQNHRDLIDSVFALNEGSGVGLRDGKRCATPCRRSEKVPVDYGFEVKNVGGHSSVPSKDSAIYPSGRRPHARLSQFDFPFSSAETTSTWLEEAAGTEDKQVAADLPVSVTSAHPDPAAVARLSARPVYNAQLRTTCVATLLEGGHADNALPQRAQATINCRVLPGESMDEVQKTLVRVLADDQISVTPTWTHVASAPSPLSPEVFGAIKQVTAEFWPGIPVIPTMSTGATDGSFLRNVGIPMYGTSGLASDIDDVRAHGKDERVSVKSIYEGQEYLYRLVKLLASGT